MNKSHILHVNKKFRLDLTAMQMQLMKLIIADRLIGMVWYTDLAVREGTTPLREITFTSHTGSHSVTCHPAAVTFPPLPQPKLVLDLVTRRDARLS